MNIFTISPCVMFLYCYKTTLLHGLLTGFEDWYMYVYMYWWDKRPCCVTIWLYISEYNLLGHDTLTFYSFYFIFCLEVTWYLCVYHLWYRGKTTLVAKTSRGGEGNIGLVLDWRRRKTRGGGTQILINSADWRMTTPTRLRGSQRN